jgi:CheY-like chemotaxis protein
MSSAQHWRLCSLSADYPPKVEDGKAIRYQNMHSWRATVFIQRSSIVERVAGPLGISSRILLVDDNHLQAATRRAILEGSGREVWVASQGAKALEMLNEAEITDGIGLIITDHLMPVMSGPELVAEVRERGFTLPVIVLSGLPDAEAAYEGLDVVFRLKPFDPDSLILLVQDLLGEQMRRSA